MFNVTSRRIVASTCVRSVKQNAFTLRSFSRSFYGPVSKSKLKVTGFQFQLVKCADRYRSRLHFLPGVLLGFAGFSFFSKEKEEEKEEEDPLIILLKWAKLYEIRHDLQQASDYYHKALALLLEREHESEWTDEQVLEGKVYIYDGMANAAFAMFKLDEAEKLYKETIKGLLQNKDKDDNAIIEISLKLATIYTIERRFEEAKDGYNYCIDHLDNKLKSVNRDIIRIEDPEDESGNVNTLALLGMCKTSYGRFLILQSKYSEAYDTLSSALTIARQVYGEDHDQVAVLCNDLSTVASHLNNLPKAKEFVQSAIEVGRAVESENLAMFYCNLCYICLDMQEWEQGRRSAKAAIRLARNKEEKDLEEQAVNCLNDIKKKVRPT